MPRYQAKEDCFVDINFYKAGAKFNYEGKPYAFMEELDDDDKPIKAASKKKTDGAEKANPDSAAQKPVAPATPSAGKQAI